MDRSEHLLTILGEECSEVHQETSKALRFGVYEQRDLSTSNIERMNKEYNHVLAMIDMINDEAGVTLLYRREKVIAEKKAKVEEYLKYSAELGTLKDGE